MAEEKKKKGVTREERIKRSFPKGSKFVDKILKKDAEIGRDSKAIVAFPPQRGPGLPKQGVTTAPPKIKKETKPSRPKETKLAGTKAVAASTLTEAQRQALSNNQASKKKKETKKDPLAGKPRSIAAAKKAGQLYFFDKNGVKKLAVTKADLKRTGLSLREYANKYAPKKVTKKEAEKFKIKKAGGGMMKKKGFPVTISLPSSSFSSYRHPWQSSSSSFCHLLRSLSFSSFRHLRNLFSSSCHLQLSF